MRLTGSGTIKLDSASKGSLIAASYQTFVIDGPMLEGISGNNRALVYVGNKGIVELRDGVIKGNKSSQNGGGVYINTGGTFTMKGGTIENNETTKVGGGVCNMTGTFTMEGGTIRDNKAANGGGVYVNIDGEFTINDAATIIANTATDTSGKNGVHIADNPSYTPPNNVQPD